MIACLRAAAGLALTTPIILSLPTHAQTATVRIPAVTSAINIEGTIDIADWDEVVVLGPWDRFGGRTPVQEAPENPTIPDRTKPT